MFPETFETDISTTLGGMERLEMFFPFDPILLTKSDRFANIISIRITTITYISNFQRFLNTSRPRLLYRFIRPHYVYWSSVNPTYTLNERDTSDEDDDNDDSDREDHEMACSLRESELLDECDQLNKMSVSSDHYIPVPQSQEASHRMPSRIKPSMYPESF